jgi:hypothetical protein
MSLVPLCVGLLGRERTSTTSRVPTTVGRIYKFEPGTYDTTFFNMQDTQDGVTRNGGPSAPAGLSLVFSYGY